MYIMCVIQLFCDMTEACKGAPGGASLLFSTPPAL